jgi:hypothetical protein
LRRSIESSDAIKLYPITQEDYLKIQYHFHWLF